MKYQYRAANADGGLVSGTVAAETIRAAARMLRRQGLVVVDVKNDADQIASHGRKLRPPPTRDVLMAMHQLCTLLESGVTLEETVESFADSAGHPFLARQFYEINASLRRGISFSEALKACKLRIPGYFGPLAEAGELTGKLAPALRDGVAQWEYDIRTANELRNALTYPVILVISGISAVFLIFALVVPKFVNLLEKAKGEVPLLARMVLGTGSFVNKNMALMGVVAVLIAVLAVLCYRNKKIRQRGRDFLAGLPFFKSWMIETDIAGWSGMVSTLLENRVPLLKALEMAQRHVSLTLLSARLTHVSQSVRNGSSLAAALQDMDAITATGYNLIRVGERSGELPRMLRSLATLYSESGRNRVKRFLVLLEPMAILIIGAAVGIIMAGIMQAITSVNNISF